MNKIELIKGDCLEVMDKLIEQDVKVDAVITDPPYGINYQTFRTKSDKLINDDNLLWVDSFAEKISQILKHENHLYCFVDAEYSAEFIISFRKYGFKIRNLLTIPRAVKGNGGDRIFQQQNEFCIFATLGKKDKGRKFNETQILKPSEGYLKDKRYQAKEWLYRLPDYWHWTKASEHNTQDKLHPTQKYVPCIEDMIKLSTNENEVVFDPFSGSFTTAIACMNTNRNFIGIEKDDKYFEIGVNRIKESMNENFELIIK